MLGSGASLRIFRPQQVVWVELNATIVFFDASSLTSAMCQFSELSPSKDDAGMATQPSYFVSVGFPIISFALLKPCHLTGLPEHCSFVGLFVARDHRDPCAQSDSRSDANIISDE